MYLLTLFSYMAYFHEKVFTARFHHLEAFSSYLKLLFLLEEFIVARLFLSGESVSSLVTVEESVSSQLLGTLFLFGGLVSSQLTDGESVSSQLLSTIFNSCSCYINMSLENSFFFYCLGTTSNMSTSNGLFCISLIWLLYDWWTWGLPTVPGGNISMDTMIQIFNTNWIGQLLEEKLNIKSFSAI